MPAVSVRKMRFPSVMISQPASFAIHLDPDLLDSTIRFSFSFETTKEELDMTLEALKELLPVLRKYTRH